MMQLDYQSGYYEKILNPILQTPYLYIGFVFNKVVLSSGTTGTLIIGELKTFGKDDIFVNTWTTNSNGTMYNTSFCNVGIGTINNISSKITINDIVNDRWTYDHSTSPLTVTNQTGTGTTINDPQPILNLCRQGVGSVSYGARATFKLCRYENSGVNQEHEWIQFYQIIDMMKN